MASPKALPFRTLFDEFASLSVGGSPAVSESSLVRDILPRVLPELRSLVPRAHGPASEYIRGINERYGGLGGPEAGAPVETKPTGSGRRAVTAHTYAQAATYLWEGLVLGVEAVVLKVLDKKLTPAQTVRFSIMANSWGVVAPFVCQAVLGDASVVGAEITGTTADRCADDLVDWCACGLCVEVDKHMTQALLSSITSVLEPSRFLSKTIARSSAMHELIGVSLAKMLRGYLHDRQWGFEVRSAPPISEMLLQELVTTRQNLSRAQIMISQGGRDLNGEMCIVSDHIVLCGGGGRATDKNILGDRASEAIAVKIAVVELFMKMRMTLSRVPQTIAEVENHMQVARGGRGADVADTLKYIQSRWSIARTVLEVDAALDAHLAARITQETTRTHVLTTPLGYGI